MNYGKQTVIFLVLLLVVNFCPAQHWTSAPVNSQSPITVVADSSGENVFTSYFASASLWKSSQGSFTNLNLAIGDNNGECIYGYFFNLSGNGERILMSPTITYNHSVFYISNDYGNTWDLIEGLETNNPLYIYVDPDNPDIIFIVTGGSTWTTFDGFDSFERHYHQTLFSAGIFKYQDEYYIHYSINEGSSEHATICQWDTETSNWNFENPILDSNTALGLSNARFASIIPLSNGEILISLLTYVGDNVEDYRTNRLLIYNSEWELVTRSGSEFFDWSKPYYMVEDGLHPGTIYVDAIWPYKSIDYGRTWQLVQIANIQNARTDYIYQQPASHDLYIFVIGYGLYKSDDSGDNWTEVPLPGVTGGTDIRMLRSSIYLGDTSSNWFKYSDGNWETLPYPSTSIDTCFYPMQLFYFNQDTIAGRVGYSLRNDPDRTFNEYFVFSEDNGTTWEYIDCPDNNYFKFKSSGNGVYIVDHEWMETTFQMTTDFGRSWTTHEKPNLNFTLANDFIYSFDTSGDDVRLVKLPIGQFEWEYTGLSLSRIPTYIREFGQSLLVVANNECYWCSGRDWEQNGQLEGGTITDILVFEYNDETIVIVNSEDSNFLRISRDLCNTWEYVYIEMPEYLPEIQLGNLLFDSANDRIWLATDYAPLWAPVEQALSSPEKPVQLQPADFDLFAAYPNPFNASTRIQYNLAQPGNVKLDVFDITGRLVKTLQNTYQPAGIQSVFFDGSGLASGTYLLKLNTGNNSRSCKVTIIK